MNTRRTLAVLAAPLAALIPAALATAGPQTVPVRVPVTPLYYAQGPTLDQQIAYANCDGSKVFPYITANDISCFYSKAALQDPWANCDGSKAKPLITANDYICFMNAYAAAVTWQNSVTINPATDPLVPALGGGSKGK